MQQETFGFPRSHDEYLLTLLQVQLFVFLKKENKLEMPLHHATFTKKRREEGERRKEISILKQTTSGFTHQMIFFGKNSLDSTQSMIRLIVLLLL